MNLKVKGIGVIGKLKYGSIFLLFLLVVVACATLKPTKYTTQVEIKDTFWHINGNITYPGSPAEGLLMNVRMVNAVFEDTGPQGRVHHPSFDTEKNTDRFIQQIPAYVDQGIKAFTISLQGGLPGYEGAINSAFNADGSLRENYMNRVEKVINAADQNGGVIMLTCFYQRQHSHVRALEGKEAIKNAVQNVASWVGNKGFANVLLEISNEYAHGGYNNWEDGNWLKSVEGQVELIRHAKDTAPGLLVSTSGMGNGRIAEPIAQIADYVLIHFNNTALEDIPERIEQAKRYGKPVVCNEDDKIGHPGAEAARLSVLHGAGWGLMHSKKNQDVPFEFDGKEDDPIIYNMVRRLTTPGESIDQLSSDIMSLLITQPMDGDIFNEGENLTLRAALNRDKQGGWEVHFFEGENRIGISGNAPWEAVWRKVPKGKFRLTAKLYDSSGKEILTSRLVDLEVKSDGQGQMVFPGKEWRETLPEKMGVDSQKLETAVSYLNAHSGADGVKELIIVRNGHLIWKGNDIHKVHNVWSLTKSFTSTVMGLLIQEGKLNIDTPVKTFVSAMGKSFPEVTFRHFTTMTSGYMALGDEPGISHGQSKTPFTPALQPLFSPPGSQFAYWDSTVNLFAKILTQIAGESIEELFKRKIADPIGMEPGQWDWKDWGNIEELAVNGGAGNLGKGIFISSYELAKFGHLFLNNGRWEDRQLIQDQWVEEATSVQVSPEIPVGHSSSSGGPGRYGFNWWTNGQDEKGLRKWPDAPIGTYAASGFNNNDLFVIPEWGLVIVRLGLDQNEFPITDHIYNTFLQKIGQSIK